MIPEQILSSRLPIPKRYVVVSSSNRSRNLVQDTIFRSSSISRVGAPFVLLDPPPRRSGVISCSAVLLADSGVRSCQRQLDIPAMEPEAVGGAPVIGDRLQSQRAALVSSTGRQKSSSPPFEKDGRQKSRIIEGALTPPARNDLAPTAGPLFCCPAARPRRSRRR